MEEAKKQRERRREGAKKSNVLMAALQSTTTAIRGSQKEQCRDRNEEKERERKRERERRFSGSKTESGHRASFYGLGGWSLCTVAGQGASGCTTRWITPFLF